MIGRGSGAGRLIAIPALLLALWIVSVTVIAWRGLGRSQARVVERLAQLLGFVQEPAVADAAVAGPVQLDDPRLDYLRRAADSWRLSAGRKRLVVDQVCLVPDVATFLEAIAAWDERHFFPILIDEPAWTLPFLRAFRPGRVVRFAGRARPEESLVQASTLNPPAESEVVWSRALQAVARAWSGPSESSRTLPDASLPPRTLGATPPGVVLTAPQAPMLAGAVALAAGHFQPLVRAESSIEVRGKMGHSIRPPRFGDVLTVEQAWQFARRVEALVGSVIPRHGELGDDCDFLTIAADWPYRYSCDVEGGPLRGLYALDDLIGRRLESPSGTNWLDRARPRWAYSGRLMGDPAASVARAMGALFLEPDSALLWNTYIGQKPWSDYSMGAASAELSRAIPGTGAVVHCAGRQADLANWHRQLDPFNPFSLVLMNSSGAPAMFAIRGGLGRPSDLPRGVPAAVAMIHSFSAADPTDPQTIAGRWLAQGAFVYFGAMNEPFLLAFRPPRLVAELMAAEIPFVAALRRGELEAFGFPWRFVFLGDPLYRLQNNVMTPELRQNHNAGQPGRGGRIDATEWQMIAPDYADWPVAEITAPAAGTNQPVTRRVSESDDERFRWCVDMAISDLVGPPSRVSPSRFASSAGARDSTLPNPGWHAVLRQIRRDRLDRAIRPFFDELLIDALEDVGAVDELMTRLAHVPPGERGPRVWQALENCGMARLARLAQERDTARSLARALDVWDQLMRLGWPKNSQFPAHFTERVAAVVGVDARRCRLWLDRLRQAGDVLSTEPDRFPHAAVIASERARVESQLRGLGTPR